MRSTQPKPIPIDRRAVRRRSRARRGGSLIEFVAILPVMFIITIGSVDICNTIFIKQFITEVTYQGAMEGSHPGVTEDELQTSLQNYLSARGIDDATVTTQGLGGTTFDDLERGDAFEVLIELAGENRTPGPVIVKSVDLNARSVGMRQ